MAINLASKAPTGVMRYGWTPAILDGDSLQSATLTVSSGTAVIDSYSIEGDSVYFFASGGANGETTIIAASAVTTQGETLPDTLYIPIRATPNSFSYTVRDVCEFALRPIVGIGASATASELDDATEHLSDMLAMWAQSGADIGVKLPVDASDILYIDDSHVIALKNNLRVHIAELYGVPVNQFTFQMANRGLQRIKNALLTDDRESTFY